MPTIEVDSDTFEKIALTASLLETTPGAVVRKLVMRSLQVGSDLPEQRTSDNAPGPSHDEWVEVHRSYKGHLIRAVFRPSSSEVCVTSAPWNGKVFSSPTAAAQAVVAHFSPSIATHNTNGRSFWKLTGRRGDLRNIMGTRF